MNYDAIVVGGGLAGSALADQLAQSGHRVLVLERETKFKDRVRGENMLPWGVAAARRMGLLDSLVGAGGNVAPHWRFYVMGHADPPRDLRATTPSGDTMLNMFHPDLQETLLARAIASGVEVLRGATVLSLDAGPEKSPSVTFEHDGKTQTISGRIVVGADGRASQDAIVGRLRRPTKSGSAHDCRNAHRRNERTGRRRVSLHGSGDRDVLGAAWQQAFANVFRVSGRCWSTRTQWQKQSRRIHAIGAIGRHPARVARRRRVGGAARGVRGSGQVGSVPGKTWCRADRRCGGLLRSVMGIGTLAHAAGRGAPRERASFKQRLERCAQAVRVGTRRVLRGSASNSGLDDAARVDAWSRRRRAARSRWSAHSAGSDWVPRFDRARSVRVPATSRRDA